MKTTAVERRLSDKMRIDEKGWRRDEEKRERKREIGNCRAIFQELFSRFERGTIALNACVHLGKNTPNRKKNDNIN